MKRILIPLVAIMVIGGFLFFRFKPITVKCEDGILQDNFINFMNDNVKIKYKGSVKCDVKKGDESIFEVTLKHDDLSRVVKEESYYNSLKGNVKRAYVFTAECKDKKVSILAPSKDLVPNDFIYIYNSLFIEE